MSIKNSKSSHYRCGFCRKRLSTLPMSWIDCLFAFTLTRLFQCGHCFTVYRRPFRWLGSVPGVARASELFAGDPAKPAGMLKPGDGQVAGPTTQRIAKFGRWVQKVEKSIGRAFGAVFSLIWFIPSRLLGIQSSKKRKGRSRGKFLK